VNEPTTACVLIIGNEILSGRTQDKNIQFLARELNEAGIRLLEVRVIPDVRDTIVATLNEVRPKYDYVFTTGGIGPTHDDITTECVAAAFGLETYIDQRAVDAMRARRPEMEMNPARLRMATFPLGAELIANPVSAAPGYRIGNVYVLAGIPVVMQAMFDSMKHLLRGGAPVRSRAIRISLGEGTIAQGLAEVQARYPDVDIGSYPSARGGRLGVSLVFRATDTARIDPAVDEVKALVRALGDEPEDEKLDAESAG